MMGEFFKVAYRFDPRDSTKHKSPTRTKTSGSSTNVVLKRTSKNLEKQETVEYVNDTGTHHFEQMLHTGGGVASKYYVANRCLFGLPLF